MSQIPHGDRVATSNRGQHGSNKINPTQKFQFLRIEIIPTTIVHPLSKKLNRRLGSEFLLLGHVEIVDENYNFILTAFGPEITFPTPSTNFAIDQPLYLVCICLA